MKKNHVILAIILIMVALNISVGYFAFAEPPDYFFKENEIISSVYQGDSINYELTLASLRNYESNMILSVKEAPEGVDVLIENENVFLKNDENLTISLTVNVKSDAPAGLYDIVIEANGDGLIHSITPQINIIGTGQIIVIIKDFWFYPDNLTIQEGSEVIWINQDLTGHTATSDNGIFDTALLQQNQKSISILFEKSGKYPYYCTPHPQMVGSVRVVE